MSTKKSIVFLSIYDVANVTTMWSYSLNKHSEEYEGTVICKKPHPFNYLTGHDYDYVKIKGNKMLLENIKKLITNSHRIILSLDDLAGLKQKKISYMTAFSKVYNINLNPFKNKTILFHPGSYYRDLHKILDPLDNNYLKVIYCYDLERLSSLDDSKRNCLYPTIHGINENYKNEIDQKFSTDKLYIFHIPSSKLTKRTDRIIELMKKINNNKNKIKNDFEFSCEYNLSNENVLNKIKKGHIYIDQISDIGTFGVSSIEAMNYGNIVCSKINNVKNRARIKANYDNSTYLPIIELCDDKEENIKIITELLNTDIKILKNKAHNTYNWFIQNISYQNTCNKLEKLLN